MFRTLLVSLWLFALLPSTATAQPLPHLQTSAEALTQDAQVYASHYSVGVDEAMRRLRAQRETVAVTDSIAANYGERLAGIVIEHRPTFRIVVSLTGDEAVSDRSVTAGGMMVPIHFQTGARATRAATLSAIMLAQADIRAMLTRPPGLGIDPRTGEMVVVVTGPDANLRASGEPLTDRIAEVAGVPVRIAAFDRGDVDMAIEGGGRVVGTDPSSGQRFACTAGFAVSDGERDGIVTAAHCPDALAYLDAGGRSLPLDFAGQWGWGYQDVQLNVAPGGVDAGVYTDTAKTLLRPIETARPRASTRAGDFVCHRGERTGYSCAEVAMVDFAPAGDLCGGPCLPTWVAVEGPTCKGGDSGAPVFDGTTALGLVKGGTYRSDGACVFYYYMSTDYLPPGWRLKTVVSRAPPSPEQRSRRTASSSSAAE